MMVIVNYLGMTTMGDVALPQLSELKVNFKGELKPYA
jgi:hypothetical protein